MSASCPVAQLTEVKKTFCGQVAELKKKNCRFLLLLSDRRIATSGYNRCANETPNNLYWQHFWLPPCSPKPPVVCAPTHIRLQAAICYIAPTFNGHFFHSFIQKAHKMHSLTPSIPTNNRLNLIVYMVAPPVNMGFTLQLLCYPFFYLVFYLVFFNTFLLLLVYC